MKSDIGIVKGKAQYPEKNTLFRPTEAYPEYPFEEYSSSNNVYEMVRECFHVLKMDASNYGKKQWNPLGGIIFPGDTVLVKPNLVRHINYSGLGEDCLYTHPSVTAAVLDYIIIALKGTGKIIVGDAPVQSCDFDVLTNESGYGQLIEYYQRKGIQIGLQDFRNVKTDLKDTIFVPQKSTADSRDDGIIVRLDKESAFYKQDFTMKREYRVTCYDPDELHKHHFGERHEYKINRAVLEADVIINLPKPKTHRKAGITGALKNMVGICTNKEYLPHHTRKSIQEGGDEYERKNDLLAIASDVLDIKNRLIVHKEYDAAQKIDAIYKEVWKKGKIAGKEFYSEGSWYKNDTIWRTISDLNKIVFYADQTGVMCPQRQRRIFHIGDMIISGHKEGPLLPEPIKTGMIIMGEDPVLFDRAVCRIMGFSYHYIPSLENEDIYETKYSYYSGKKENVFANSEYYSDYNMKRCRFVPSKGWEMLLGNPYKDEVINRIKQEKLTVFLWGAGVHGIQSAEYLRRRGVEVKSFLDNDSLKDQTIIWNDVTCSLPYVLTEENSICIISVPNQYVGEVKQQALTCCFKYISIFE